MQSDTIATTLPGNKIKTVEWIRAPSNLPGIRVGTKFAVIESFISDKSCPYGVGFQCHCVQLLERKYLVIQTNNKGRGVAWIKQSPQFKI